MREHIIFTFSVLFSNRVDVMGDSYDYLFKILIIGNTESNKHRVLDKFLDETTAGRSPRGNLTVGTPNGSSQGNT